MIQVRLIKHEAVPRCGSFQVRFSNGFPSQYFYWDDEPGRCLRRAALAPHHSPSRRDHSRML
jgi:hypothetical protein